MQNHKINGLYNLIARLPKRGIWGFINEKDKKVWLSASKSIGESIVRNVNEIVEGTHPIRGLSNDSLHLDALLCEEITCNFTRHLHLVFYQDLYLSNGYTLYNNKLPPFHVEIQVAKQKANGARLEAHVVVHNRRALRIVVGVFTTTGQATEFISRYYPNSVDAICFANNPETKRYVLENK